MTRTYYWKMDPEQIYTAFLQIAEKLIEKNSTRAEKPTKQRLFQHEMYVKFAYHLASILTLEQGSVFSKTDAQKKAHDYSSVIVLFRAALETFLTYYYLYGDSAQEDELTFRYHNWLIDGLGFRQRVNVKFSPELQAKQEKERLEIQESIQKIRSTAAFLALSDKQKRLVVEKLQWFRPCWAKILAKTGIAEYWSKTFYALYSAYAHTSSLSIMQFKDATVRNEGRQLNSVFANLVYMAAALFCDYYMKGFGLAGSLDAAEMEMLEAWIWMARHLP